MAQCHSWRANFQFRIDSQDLFVNWNPIQGLTQANKHQIIESGDSPIGQWRLGKNSHWLTL